ncbi:substrate-binding domain-containing protein [Burkholderia lata]|uniref:Phosphate ABC transporter substrate-binding protein, PhoT family n=1 Tax=Burkholderia lata (strain ATCC 17760 / DSM 23089 / LMG 22485 / NCIMB 9086 / R18194 / 383) TaxID=482957 RepID=Q398C8_BURL3|nr:substrate-binding domain-containing protein [Burkholderia lata]ABB11183.1 phosphate ABC transporter substrate-binding protein, PhoT family [Burkholderia lata]
MEFQQRNLCRIVALLIAGIGSTAAIAAGPLVQGGGSSLVAPMIGEPGIANTEIGLFGTAEATLTYYPVGSGNGQNAFLKNQPTFLGSQNTGMVDFAYSDAALSSSQITSYKTGLGTTNGPLIQIPYIVTPITVPIINGPAVTSTTTPQTTPGQAHSIALNDDDLCGVFSGKLTNWNQVTNPETGSVYTLHAPITVVYRSDSSGTTELLTRHLVAVCTTANTAPGVTFVDSTTFTASFPTGFPSGSTFVAASGSGGVRNQLVTYATTTTTTAAVAYLSPAYTNTYLAPQSTVTTSASATQLPVASLRNTAIGTYYAPTYANASMALSNFAPPTAGIPARNQVNWVPNAGNPTSGYPVSGTSQIILSQCYADPNIATAMHDLLNSHYTNASFASIVHGNGFDMVASNYLAAISQDFLSNTSTYNLDIGNTSICRDTVTGR